MYKVQAIIKAKAEKPVTYEKWTPGTYEFEVEDQDFDYAPDPNDPEYTIPDLNKIVNWVADHITLEKFTLTYLADNPTLIKVQDLYTGSEFTTEW